MSALVGIVMGSTSDWPVMEHCSQTLDALGIEHEVRILSAHRTPEATAEWASTAADRGLQVIIAAAGGAAHLAGVVAGHTELPVLGVPMSSVLDGLDSLLSTVQMPAGVPVATLAIGKAGAVNAALFAGQVLGRSRPEVAEAFHRYREGRKEKVLATGDPRTAG